MNSEANSKEQSYTSACYNRTPIEGPNTLIELPLCGKISLRGSPESESFLRAVETACNMALPLQANTFQQNENLTIFWMGPDEWQINCDMSMLHPVITDLSAKLDGIHHSIVDVSDYYTTLQLSGPNATEILRRGCPLDLHPSVFPVGSIAQTRFGHGSVLLFKRNDKSTFDIQIRWSFAEYTWDYISSVVDSLE